VQSESREKDRDKALRQQRDRFLFFAFAAADLFLEVTSEGEIIFVLGAGRDILGCDPETVSGGTLADIFSQADRTLIDALLRDFEAGVRFGPIGVRLAPPYGDGRVFLQGFRLPERQNLFYIAVATAPSTLRSLDTGDAEAADGPGVPFDETSLGATVTATLRQAREAGRQVDLTLLELEGLEEAKQNVGAAAIGETLDRVIGLLRTQSFGGQPINYINAEKYVVLHDAEVSGDRMAQSIAACGAEYGLRVARKTIPLSKTELDPQDAARAVVYTVNRFARTDDEAMNLQSLNDGYEQMLAETAARIAECKTTIADDAIKFAMQPIVDLETRKISRYEMLSRIDGYPSPFQFMTFAEEVGLIADVDLYVCRQALKHLASDPRLAKVPVAVNLSGRSLQAERFVDALFALLRSAPAELRERLTFEITESAQIHDLDGVSKVIAALRKEGFEIGLDDFGAGSNSFSALYRLDVDFMKIDGDYVSRIMDSARDVAMLKAMVGLARDLGIPTVAERIENEAQARKVRALQVNYGQGYLFGKPETHPASPLPLIGGGGKPPSGPSTPLRPAKPKADEGATVARHDGKDWVWA
jgi:EAL domain-containing protein (putative c-di-GMP-specific phosphodiesterase class I)